VENKNPKSYYFLINDIFIDKEEEISERKEKKGSEKHINSKHNEKNNKYPRITNSLLIRIFKPYILYIFNISCSCSYCSSVPFTHLSSSHSSSTIDNKLSGKGNNNRNNKSNNTNTNTNTNNSNLNCSTSNKIISNFQHSRKEVHRICAYQVLKKLLSIETISNNNNGNDNHISKNSFNIIDDNNDNNNKNSSNINIKDSNKLMSNIDSINDSTTNSYHHPNHYYIMEKYNNKIESLYIKNEYSSTNTTKMKMKKNITSTNSLFSDTSNHHHYQTSTKKRDFETAFSSSSSSLSSSNRTMIRNLEQPNLYEIDSQNEELIKNNTIFFKKYELSILNRLNELNSQKHSHSNNDNVSNNDDDDDDDNNNNNISNNNDINDISSNNNNSSNNNINSNNNISSSNNISNNSNINNNNIISNNNNNISSNNGNNNDWNINRDINDNNNSSYTYSVNNKSLSEIQNVIDSSSSSSITIPDKKFMCCVPRLTKKPSNSIKINGR